MTDRDKLRYVQLEIIKEIKRICEKHNIQYFLDAGSMIGAVRHKGFIPWDDDIDVGMVKDEYFKFLDIASKELSDNFFIDNYYSNENNPLVFTKVRYKDTLYIEQKGNENLKHNEIFVDVFPYYYISDNYFHRKIEAAEMSVWSQALMSKSGYKVWSGDGILKRIKFVPIDILGHFMSCEYIHKRIEYLFEKNRNGRYMCIHAGSCYGYWFFPNEILKETILVDFEGIKLPILKAYDFFLSVAYGDYMTVPPKEKQITHNIKKLEFGNIVFSEE